MAVQLMPDHIHGILFVTRPVPYHLGKVVNGFKIGCNAAARELLFVAPWPYHSERRKITREQCLQLNSLAGTIAGLQGGALHYTTGG